MLQNRFTSSGIGDGQAPFYDFELQFIAAEIPALGFRQYRISPMPDGQCHGGDVAAGSKIAREMSAFSRHELRYGTFRLNFHRFHRFEPDLRGHTRARDAACSYPRSRLADVVLIQRFYGRFPPSGTP